MEVTGAKNIFECSITKTYSLQYIKFYDDGDQARVAAVNT